MTIKFLDQQEQEPVTVAAPKKKTTKKSSTTSIPQQPQQPEIDVNFLIGELSKQFDQKLQIQQQQFESRLVNERNAFLKRMEQESQQRQASELRAKTLEDKLAQERKERENLAKILIDMETKRVKEQKQMQALIQQTQQAAQVAQQQQQNKQTQPTQGQFPVPTQHQQPIVNIKPHSTKPNTNNPNPHPIHHAPGQPITTNTQYPFKKGFQPQQTQQQQEEEEEEEEAEDENENEEEDEVIWLDFCVCVISKLCLFVSFFLVFRLMKRKKRKKKKRKNNHNQKEELLLHSQENQLEIKYE